MAFHADRRRRDTRQYTIKELRDKHREIARQSVLGRTHGEIAAALGCTPQTVSNVVNSPLNEAERERLHGVRDAEVMGISQRIEEFVPHALAILEDIITGRMPGASVALRAKVAAGHLARAGYGEVHKVAALHARVTPEDIAAIKERSNAAVLEISVRSSE